MYANNEVFGNSVRRNRGTGTPEHSLVYYVMPYVSFPFPGPISAALVNKFGCRPVAIAGAAFASISFFVSTFSPNIECMIVFYGFCGGRWCFIVYLY